MAAMHFAAAISFILSPQFILGGTGSFVVLGTYSAADHLEELVAGAHFFRNLQ